MVSRVKSPQEQAAEIIAAVPFYSDYTIPKKEATQLSKKARKLKREVEDLRPYQLSDKELSSRLRTIKQKAIAAGVWSPNKGEGNTERLEYAIRRSMAYGYTQQEATARAGESLSRDGYLAAIRQDRKEKNDNFFRPINEFIKSQVKNTKARSKDVNIIDLCSLSTKAKSQLCQDFPSGNFLYHGSYTEQVIQILDSGHLANSSTLYEAEEKLAKAEGRETELLRRHSGFEGISWSLNDLDALPGDRYHLAGFLAAPETALGKREQLTIPSRPAIYEVIHLSGNAKVSKYYEAKTQLELYFRTATFGEANSVFNNLWAVSDKRKNPHKNLSDKPLLYVQGKKLTRHKNYVNKLRDLYTIDDNGLIYLSHDLLGQSEDEIPVAAVWLQAAIDTNRLSNTVFANKNLADIIELMNSKNTYVLLHESKKDWLPFQEVLDDTEAKTKHVKVLVESMYLVAAKKDATVWLKVLAHTSHQPKGLLLYDDKKVRLENFATLHRGDHAELTRELRNAIPAQKGFIPYNEVLGVDLEDSMRAGHHHQIIAEKHLANRGVIKKVDGKLVVER